MLFGTNKSESEGIFLYWEMRSSNRPNCTINKMNHVTVNIHNIEFRERKFEIPTDKVAFECRK